MRFEVQDYLRGGKTLEDLEREYAIKCNVCEPLGVVSLNYNQIESDMSLDIPQECRGLILELDTWNVVSRSFRKFYNLDEPHNKGTLDAFDWSSAKVYDKVDGSLIPMYFYKGEWQVSTRGIADANTEVWGAGITFRELILDTMKQMGFEFAELDTNVLYSFELTTPWNQIVVPYDGQCLTWLAAWDRNTLEELDIYELPELMAPKVSLLPLSNLDEIMERVDELTPTEGEGVVVVDKNFQRMKIKSAEYLKAFHVITSVEATPRNRLAVILSDKYDDIYGLLPEFKRKEMEDLKDKFGRLVHNCRTDFEEIKHLERKEFALAVQAKKVPYSGWLFSMYGGKTMTELLEACKEPKTMPFHYLEKVMENNF